MQIDVLFCQRFKPIFESAITTKPASNGYKFYESKVNDDDNPLWDRFSISAVPTLIAFGKRKDHFKKRCYNGCLT